MPKKRKPRDTRKPRDEHIYATTAGAVSEILFTVDERTGAFRFEQPMENIYYERSYARPKGPKVISRIPQAQKNLDFEETPALLANYDKICAVDTNTRLISGRPVSMTGVTTLHREGLPTAEGPVMGWRFDVPFCLQFDDLTVPPENFGWVMALVYLRREGFFSAGDRIGVIVDSDLGNLRAYNDRKAPVIEGQYLMEGATLIYASADTGKEALVNRALQIADTTAALSLQGLESGVIPPIARSITSPIFTGHRVIAVNAKEGPLGITRVI